MFYGNKKVIEFSSLRPTANAIRALTMDAVQNANSGHPGAPMGMADIADVLWREHLRHNPKNPQWADRDRFVLSNGHGSMLLYALLHLSGYDLSLDELKKFRQWGSKTPGHPESVITPGVETTTGPLGQGVANAVGMALAEKMLASQYNRLGHEIINHRTWVFAGDGCLMEGISHEACSLAGTWALNKLTLFYDANAISIDGHIKDWFTDDTAKRFEAYGWQVIGPIDGHCAHAVNLAIVEAKSVCDKPTLIICKTVIGCGSPNKGGTADAHGAPLGVEEIAATRQTIGWNAQSFNIPDAVAKTWNASTKGSHLEADWKQRFSDYQQAFPHEARILQKRLNGESTGDETAVIEAMLNAMQGEKKAIATRKASQLCLKALMGKLPEWVGGSADLAGSNLTDTPQSVDVMNDFSGNRISFGVREFGMAAIANGVSLHGGFRPFVATFLVFSDYARNAIRMAALMQLPITYVFTHDSIGLGEDGPTHQPIEHLPSLRLIPNLMVWRPADAVETAVAWGAAIRASKTPTVLALSRQALPMQIRDTAQTAAITKGGYILADAPQPKAVIIATGSEVALAMSAKLQCEAEGIEVRVVSMPCAEIFAQQSKAYQIAVLPAAIPRLAVEASHGQYWRAWVGLEGEVIGMRDFGGSAPADVLFKQFGFKVANIVETVKSII